jgi:vacuolar iron transporter family protein
LQDAVFGLNDGLVTTLVFILAVSAVAASKIALIAFGEVVAGGVSMALGGFLSTRTNQEVIEQRIATELLEIQQEPEEERAELREIYAQKGLEGTLLDDVIDALTSTEERWLQSMIRDEHGIVSTGSQSGLRRAAVIGGSFVLGGLVPTASFALHLGQPKLVAFALTAAVALGLGAAKSRYTAKHALRSALEFLAIVAVGTLVGFAIGTGLHRL